MIDRLTTAELPEIDARITAQPQDRADDILEAHPERYQPIIAALRDQPWRELLSSRELMDVLTAQGQDQSERTLRLHLQELVDAGLLIREGRRGYRLSEQGQARAKGLSVHRRLGSILYRMEETACQLDVEPAAGTGLVSINAYLVPLTAAAELCDDIETVFAAGLAVGSKVLIALPGEELLGRQVPSGMIGIGTMCSLSIASVLARRGVPSQAIFGGVLAIDHGRPAHFLEMIRYDATSLSPNEVFIRAAMTSVGAAARSGHGAITASFREVPMAALGRLRDTAAELDRLGFRGVLAIGRPGLPVMNIPVHEGRVGVVLATGLNPLACLWERGVLRAGAGGDASRPMVAPAAYASLIDYRRVRERILSGNAGAETANGTGSASPAFATAR